jgi:hypothetical protein
MRNKLEDEFDEKSMLCMMCIEKEKYWTIGEVLIVCNKWHAGYPIYATVIEGKCDLVRIDCYKPITKEWYDVLKDRNTTSWGDQEIDQSIVNIIPDDEPYVRYGVIVNDENLSIIGKAIKFKKTTEKGEIEEIETEEFYWKKNIREIKKEQYYRILERNSSLKIAISKRELRHLIKVHQYQ